MRPVKNLSPNHICLPGTLFWVICQILHMAVLWLTSYELKKLWGEGYPEPSFFPVCFPQWTPNTASTKGKGTQSQASAGLCPQCVTYSVNHESKPIQRSSWLCTPRLTESSVPEGALWTDKSQAAPSTRSHLKLVIDKPSIDLLFISFLNILMEVF